MALRYDNEVASISNLNTWRLEIDDEFGAYLGEIDLSSNSGVQVMYDGSAKDVLAEPGIYPSTCFIFFEVTSDTEASLVTHIRDSDQSRFSVKVLKDGALYWAGRFTTDNILVQNYPRPFTVKLEANDGLIELQNREPFFPFAENTYHDFLLYIRVCFNKMGVLSLYSGNVLAVTNMWYNSQHPNTEDDPFSMTRSKTFVWMQEKDQKPDDWEDIRWLTCYEILRRICIGWNMRLYYGNGMFHMEQIPERGGGPYRKFFYDSGLNLTSTIIASADDTIPSVGPGFKGPETGGAFGYIGALKAVEAFVDLGDGNMALGYKWTYEDNSAIFADTVQLITDELLESHLKLSIRVAQSTVPNVGQPLGTTTVTYEAHTYQFQMEIKIGDKWLKRPVYYEPITIPPLNTVVGYKRWYGPTTLEAGLSYYYTLGNKAITVPWAVHEGTYENNVPFLIELPSFEDLGYVLNDEVDLLIQSVVLQFVWRESDNVDILPIDITTEFRWWFDKTELQLISATGSVITERRYIATNDVETDKILQVESFYGDFPGTVYDLEVYDGANWIPSTQTWGLVTFNGTSPFTQFLAEQIMRVRLNTRETYTGTILSRDVRSDTVITLHGKQYTFAGGRLSTKQEAMDGEWVEVFAEDISGLTITEETVENNDFPNQTIGLPGPNEPGGETTYGLVTNEEIDGVSAYTVIQIINTSGIELPAGTIVKITDEADGTSYFVTLAADLDASDTTITIDSYTFPEVIPTLSPITIAPVDNFREYYFEVNGDGSNVYVDLPTEWVLPPTTSANTLVNVVLQVYMGSTPVFFKPTPVASADFGFSKSPNRIIYYRPIKTTEIVRVRYWGPTGL